MAERLAISISTSFFFFFPKAADFYFTDLNLRGGISGEDLTNKIKSLPSFEAC